MTFTNTGYFIREGIRSFWRNKLMSFASTIVVIITLLLFGCFVVIIQNANFIKSQLQNMYEIQVFMDREISQKRIDEIWNEIKKIENIKSIEYISKEQALIELKNNWHDGAPLLEGFENNNNPLRNSYRITLYDLNKVSEIVTKLSKINNIHRIRNNTDSLKIIIWISNLLQTSSFWQTLIFLAISVFLISNTIKIAMISRKKEIEILKYIGATNNFIRAPFLIEGMIIGLLGALVAYFAILWLYSLIYSKLETFFAGMLHAMPSDQIAGVLALILFISGPTIGTIGSVMSIKRYLKV